MVSWQGGYLILVAGILFVERLQLPTIFASVEGTIRGLKGKTEEMVPEVGLEPT
jgi:hypothetical protein